MAIKDLDLKYQAGVITAPRGLRIVSSFAGGENTYDSTNRLNLESYQRAQLTADGGGPGHFGEVLRLTSKRWDSKQMIAWRGPTSYDGSGNPVGSDVSWFWMGAHYEANDHGSVHGHWSVEVPDSTGALQTRLDMRIWDPNTGTFGMDVGQAKFYQTHLGISQNTGGVWFDYTTGNASFGLGSNAPTPTARLHVTNDGSQAAMLATGTAVGSATTAVVRIEAPGVTKRAFDIRQVGDNVSRLRIDTSASNNAGTIVFGDGTTADTNLYRQTVNVLRTDGSISVANRVGIGQSIDAAIRLAITQDSDANAIQLTNNLAGGNVNQPLIAGYAATAGSLFATSRVTGDSISRFYINIGGTMQWGAGGSSARDVTVARTAASELTLTGSLVTSGSLTVSGTVSASAPMEPTFQPSDIGLKTWTYDPVVAVNSSAPVAGTLYVMKVILRKSTTVSNILMANTSNNGTMTSGQCFAGIYDSTGALLATTADLSGQFGTSATKTWALTTTPTLAAGWYWVGLLLNGSGTIPSLSRSTGSNTANAGIAFASQSRFATNGSALTALPSSITPSANVQSLLSFWAGVS